MVLRRAYGLGAMLACGLLVSTACAATPANVTSSAGDEANTLTIFATTGYLADLATRVAPGADVTVMVGPGGDPHTYQPSTRDIEAMTEADLVLWNGLNLEAQLVDLLEGLGDAQLAVGEHVPAELLLSWPETDASGEPLYDPHIWNSPDAWAVAIDTTANTLGSIDPERAEQYAAHAERYAAEIEAAAQEAETLLAEVPEPRILITGHDAFAYFGAAFSLDVYATDYVSTEAVLSAEELSDLAMLIVEHEVPVIFQDNQANPQAITSLQEATGSLGWEVSVSDQELYADSLGDVPGVDTHLDVMRHNAHAVADALRGGS